MCVFVGESRFASHEGTRVARIARMVRFSTVGIWAVFALLVFAVAVVGAGCAESACAQSHDAEALPGVRAIGQAQAARLVSADAVSVTVGSALSRSGVYAAIIVPVSESSALPRDLALRI